jgi:hypothetical protein
MQFNNIEWQTILICSRDFALQNFTLRLGEISHRLLTALNLINPNATA